MSYHEPFGIAICIVVKDVIPVKYRRRTIVSIVCVSYFHSSFKSIIVCLYETHSQEAQLRIERKRFHIRDYENK